MPAPWSDWAKKRHRSTREALYRVVIGENNEATIGRLATMVGRPETTLRDYCNPEVDVAPPECVVHAAWLLTFHPDLEEIKVGPRHMIIERPRGQVDEGNVHKELMDLQIKLGQTLDAWSQDMADGRIDLVEVHRTNCDGLIKEMMELIHALNHPSLRQARRLEAVRS